MTYLQANWCAPNNVRALTTTRLYGHSLSPFDHNNMALHVEDNPLHVLANRSRLKLDLKLHHEPAWLDQTHSNRCVVVDDESSRAADAAITRRADIPLVIMTADCLPIVLCNLQGSEVSAIHAGWRGLLQGIVENTLQKMTTPANQLLAWIGPAICQACFQIGPEVKEQYLDAYPQTAAAFTANTQGHYADLPKIARMILHAQGVENVALSNACSFEANDQFYSYRRQAKTGRMATLIWFTSWKN